MADSQHVELLRRGMEVWNRWRVENPRTIPDLDEANLSGVNLSVTNLQDANLRAANLSGANLKDANLRTADLDGASLHEAKLTATNLHGANLSGANLSEADLTGADLREANLTGADLRMADLIWTDLREARLFEARFLETVFGDTNLTNARGLDTCIHFGPSILDYRTIVESGSLPIAFLRGCGLPDTLIDYLPSLLNQPIQFHSCFISYSTKDQEFAERLHADLQNKGVRCWFAPHDIQGGKKIHEQIDIAIQMHDRLLLILSAASMDSEWVKTEIAKSRKREIQEKRRMLFPVRLIDFEAMRQWECFDADTGKDTAREIREYYVPDFSNWKDHDSYRKEFDHLLRDLRAEERQSVSVTRK